MKIDLDFDISKNLRALLELLRDNGGSPRFVGGLVRDVVAFKDGVTKSSPIVIPDLIRDPNNGEMDPGQLRFRDDSIAMHDAASQTDIDIATKLKPDELVSLFKKNNIKYVDIGSQFGTIMAIIDGRGVEITTLRLDIDCDGRHAKVKFTDDFKEDAKRRDFTINAMSYCPFEGELYDYFGGLEDLKSGIVRFIGDPDQRIREDHLRILRFFRFSDRYAKELDGSSLNACIKRLDSVKELSAERILSELTLMMLSASAAEIYSIMYESGLLEKIFGNIEFDFDLLGQMESRDSNLRFAALLNKPESAALKALLKNLKFSNHNSAEILKLVSFRNKHGSLEKADPKNLEKIFLRMWIDDYNLSNFIEISQASKNQNIDALLDFMRSGEKPKFPIDGNDLIELGLKGPEISKAIERLKDIWVDSKFEISKAELLLSLRA